MDVGNNVGNNGLHEEPQRRRESTPDDAELPFKVSHHVPVLQWYQDLVREHGRPRLSFEDGYSIVRSARLRAGGATDAEATQKVREELAGDPAVLAQQIEALDAWTMRLLGVAGESIPGYHVVVPGTGVVVEPGKPSEVKEKLRANVKKTTRVRSRILV